MSFVKTKGFKYFKNLMIGVGAAFVLAGALFKLESWEGASEMLILGMGIEIFIFLMLGILGPGCRLLLGQTVPRSGRLPLPHSTTDCRPGKQC
jgi:hypothetical protein